MVNPPDFRLEIHYDAGRYSRHQVTSIIMRAPLPMPHHYTEDQPPVSEGVYFVDFTREEDARSAQEQLPSMGFEGSVRPLTEREKRIYDTLQFV